MPGVKSITPIVSGLVSESFNATYTVYYNFGSNILYNIPTENCYRFETLIVCVHRAFDMYIVVMPKLLGDIPLYVTSAIDRDENHGRLQLLEMVY